MVKGIGTAGITAVVIRQRQRDSESQQVLATQKPQRECVVVRVKLGFALDGRWGGVRRGGGVGWVGELGKMKGTDQG